MDFILNINAHFVETFAGIIECMQRLYALADFAFTG